MKKLLYPKTYAVCINILYTDTSIYVVRNGKVNFKTISPIMVFVTDNGEEIRQQYPRSSGSVPERVYASWRPKKDKKYRSWDYMIGCRVKLYQRPQDNGRWSYRHMGQ